MKTTKSTFLILISALCMSTFSCNIIPSEGFENGTDLSLTSLSNSLLDDESILYKKTDIVSNINELLDGVIPTKRNELSNIRTVTKIMKGDKDAGIKVPGFGDVTLGKKESSLSVYYLETKVVGSEVYGIGYSIHYLFRKVKKGISLNNLPLVAASVQLQSKKTQVTYTMQSYGIKSFNFIKFFKPVVNKNFDVDGFGVMQSSIDGVHNILSDSLLSARTNFVPQNISFLKPEDLQ